MEKRKHTHVQMLLPEIEAMISGGKTQREVAKKGEKGKVAADLRLHSDQGFQYTSQAYFNLTQGYGIMPPC